MKRLAVLPMAFAIVAVVVLFISGGADRRKDTRERASGTFQTAPAKPAREFNQGTQSEPLSQLQSEENKSPPHSAIAATAAARLPASLPAPTAEELAAWLPSNTQRVLAWSTSRFYVPRRAADTIKWELRFPSHSGLVETQYSVIKPRRTGDVVYVEFIPGRGVLIPTNRVEIGSATRNWR